ncbi:MAG: hypothetical protein JSU06_05745 [Actinobacteria bacterium]|nr:hypothetical protein [Actinomycetota bacterium]
MSLKTRLARQAVRTTAHTATAKITRKPIRSLTLLGIGAALGGLVGWLIGRSGGGGGQSDLPARPAGPTSVVTNVNSTERASEPGAVS